MAALIAAADVREAVIDGLPTLFLADGRGVPDALITSSIRSAQQKVGSDLDVLIGVHEVRCTNDPHDEDALEDHVIMHAALDKPRNWYAGDRFGALRLPYRPVKRVLSARLRPYGWNTTPITIPVERLRVSGGLLKFVPGPMNWLLPVYSVFPSYQFQDGSGNPGSIEVTFEAGLSERDLRLHHPLVPELIKLQAAIIVLGYVQGRVGGGVAKESAGADGLTNSVDLGRVDVLGPLGGIIKGMKANYNELLLAARGQLGGTMQTVWF